MSEAKQSKLQDILKRLMFEKNIKATELARKLGLPQPTIHRIATGKSPNPHMSTLLPLAEHFSLTVKQIKGEEPIPDSFWSDTFAVAKPKVSEFPVIKWEELGDIKSAVAGAQEFVFACPGFNPDCFALPMSDSSMEPHFSLGTTLIFDPAKEARDRSYVLVKLSDTDVPIFRQLLIDGEYRYLKPLNPDLTAFRMRIMQDTDQVLAVLVEARRNYDEF